MKDKSRHSDQFPSYSQSPLDITFVLKNNVIIIFNKKSFKRSNINCRDVQRKYVVNNVDKSSLRAPWQNGPYTNKHLQLRIVRSYQDA